MTLRRKMTSALTAAIAVGAGVLFAAAPASAGWSDCNVFNTLCMTTDSHYNGRIWRQTPAQIVGCRSLAKEDGWNDTATSFANMTYGYYVTFWQHANCTGNFHVLGAQKSNYFLAGDAFNDQASAIEVKPY